MSSPRQQQRRSGVADALSNLAEILQRHPGESVHITEVYEQFDWWRVCVKVGEGETLAPRFEAFDDATSFRLRAVEMASC
jgi:hypothetical protein